MGRFSDSFMMWMLLQMMLLLLAAAVAVPVPAAPGASHAQLFPAGPHPNPALAAAVAAKAQKWSLPVTPLSILGGGANICDTLREQCHVTPGVDEGSLVKDNKKSTWESFNCL